MIRVGLIGAGFIGRNHFNQYEKLGDRAKVVALCDKEADRRAGDWSKVGGNIGDKEGAQRDLGEIKPYTDWKDLVNDPNVDLVDICVPTFLHAEMTIAALKAGKHVLCEKPMALDVPQCDQILAVAADAPGQFMIAQCIRFWPQYEFLKQVIDEGKYGPLRTVHLRRQASPPTYSLEDWILNPELSGGAILDLHVHDVDYALHILGNPQSIFAEGYHRKGGGMDRIHSLWRYHDQIVVQIEGCWDLHPGFGFNMGFTAVFDDASIVWDIASGKPLTILQADQDPQTPGLPDHDGYFGEISYFIECIEKNEPPTISTPQQSRQAVALAMAEKQSAETGQLVTSF
jgi:predicted dehydrogenase